MNVNALIENNNLKDQLLDITSRQDSNKELDNSIKTNDFKTDATKTSISSNTKTSIETNSITYNNKLELPQDNVKQKEMKDIAEEEQLDNNPDRMTSEDGKEISEEGISLEKYNLERLDRALTRIKSQRLMKSEGLKSEKEQIENNQELVQRMANGSKVSKDIAEKLQNADLPVTETNIAKVANAVEMAMSALQMPDSAMNYMVKNELEPTINNIYKAVHSGYNNPIVSISDETWNSLQSQVNQIINQAGLENNEENMNSAKWLLNQQLPLTESNLYAVIELNTLKDETTKEDVVDQVITSLFNGKSAESTNLSIDNSEKIKLDIDAFQTISNEAIEIVTQTKSGEDKNKINLKELTEAQKQINNSNSNYLPESTLLENAGQNDKSLNNVDVATITVRRQLEEIRLKLTLESGQQLRKNGIHLDTDALSKIVDGLKEIENQYYVNLLKEGNVEPNKENTDIIKASIEGIEQLKSMPSYILGSTLSTRNIQTMNGLLEAGQETKQTLENAKEAYETLMTTPRTDLGDSIKKAFRNVDDILNSMNLESTNANERAVRILGYNQMEITEENIQKIKEYDQQVNHLFKNLQPAVTVELIKSNRNPLNVPLEELNKQLEELKDELGISKEEKYSKYLWKLEKEQNISEEEKKSYIGIYRLLNAVENTDGAALGSVLKANQEVTMSNLLTAVRTIKGNGINASINDDFGALSEFTRNGVQITEQIQQGFEAFKNLNITDDSPNQNLIDTTQNEYATTTEKDIEKGIKKDIENGIENYTYNAVLLDDLKETISPQKLQALGSVENLFDMSVENLYENLMQASGDAELEQEYWTQKTNDYKENIKNSREALNLLENLDIPNNLQNMEAVKNMLSADQSIYKQWKRLVETQTNLDDNNASFNISTISDNLIESFSNSENANNEYKKIGFEASKLEDIIYNNEELTSQDLISLQRFNNGISFLQKLATRESYEIPIPIGDAITQVNVTVLRNTGENGKVNISVNSESLGKLNMELTVKNNSLKGLILSDNRLGLEAFQNSKEDIIQAINSVGIDVKQMNYGIDKKIVPSYSDINFIGKENKNEDISDKKISLENNITTETLYSLAKTLLIQIKSIEKRSTYES